MRWLPLLLLVGCLPLGRRTESAGLSLRLTEPRPSWPLHEARLDLAEVGVADFVLREPVAGDWGTDAFGDRAETPHVEGVAMGVWSDTRIVDLLDPLQAFLGAMPLHDGEVATATFSVVGSIRLAGTVTRFDDEIPFDLVLTTQSDVTGVAVVDAREGTSGGSVGWRFDAAAVLSAVDWEAGVGGVLTERLEGVEDDASFSLRDAATWSVELR
jgi:hypothetical protein